MFEDIIDAEHEAMFKHLQVVKERGDQHYSLVLSKLAPALTEFGVRVKITEHGWVVLTRQITNWRINDCRNGINGVPDQAAGVKRHWCYPSGTNGALMAWLAAVTWSGKPDTEPTGWVKAMPGERRHGEPFPGITQE